MENVKKFNTKRLTIREWRQSDAPQMVEGLNNSNVSKWLTTPYPYTLDMAHDYIQSLKTKFSSTYCNWAIVERSSGNVIGGMSVDLRKPGVADGGIWINEKYHGKGYGTEAFVARAKVGFEFLKAETLDNGVFADNAASIALHKKLGYKITDQTEDIYCPTRQCNVKAYRAVLKKEDFTY